MKRRFISILVSLVLCLSMVACSKSDRDIAESKETVESVEVSVFYEKSAAAKSDFCSSTNGSNYGVDVAKMYDTAVSVNDTSIIAKVTFPEENDRDTFKLQLLLGMALFTSIGKQFNISKDVIFKDMTSNSSGTAGDVSWSYTAPGSSKEMSFKVEKKQ